MQLAYNTSIISNNENIISYIDYTHVSQAISDLVNARHFLLIEDIANITANILMKKFCIGWVRVKVSKPGAISGAFNVGVCIERKK